MRLAARGGFEVKPGDASDMRSFILREARRDLENPSRSEFARLVDDGAREFAGKWAKANREDRDERTTRMSGQSKRNPLASDYIVGSGPSVPPMKIGCELHPEVVPSQEWLDANPADAEGNRPPCPPASCDVRFLIVGTMLLPSNLIHKKDWPFGAAPVAEVHRMPFAQFMLLIVTANPDLVDAANAAVAAGKVELH